MRRRRIAFVVGSLAGGGAERVALNIAEACDSLGWDADLVLVSRHGPLLDQVPPHVRIIDLKARRARRGLRALRRYLRREAPDAVVAVTFHVNLLAVLARAGFRRTRLILSVHNTASRAFAGLSSFKRAWLRAATWLLYKAADRIVAVSRGTAEDLVATVGIDPAKIRIIYNPIVRPDFQEWMAQETDHPWASDPSMPLIVAAGRLAPQKDYPVLIHAFARVVVHRDARLMILGEGELRSELEALAAGLGLSDRVAFPGFTANPYPYMRAADIFVLSSAWEGFGNVLVEAMATGTPVISTDCEHGPREILEDGKWGRLVPPGNPMALAEAIIEVIDHGGVDATQRAHEFTVERAAEQYLRLAET